MCAPRSCAHLKEKLASEYMAFGIVSQRLDVSEAIFVTHLQVFQIAELEWNVTLEKWRCGLHSFEHASTIIGDSLKSTNTNAASFEIYFRSIILFPTARLRRLPLLGRWAIHTGHQVGLIFRRNEIAKEQRTRNAQRLRGKNATLITRSIATARNVRPLNER